MGLTRTNRDRRSSPRFHKTEIGALDPLEFYVPRTQREAADSILVLRVSGEPRHLSSLVQAVATGIDRRLQPVAGSLTDAHDRGLEKIYRPLGIIEMLGSVVLLRSFIGLAGLASYTVAQQTKEIGLRMALGAGPSQIVRAILAPMTVPVGAGLLFKTIGRSAVVTVLRSGITGIVGLTVVDSLAYIRAMVFFAAVVALAVFAPARRAIRIDPSQRFNTNRGCTAPVPLWPREPRLSIRQGASIGVLVAMLHGAVDRWFLWLLATVRSRNRGFHGSVYLASAR